MNQLQTAQVLGYAILCPRVVATLSSLHQSPDAEQFEILQAAKRLLNNSISGAEIAEGKPRTFSEAPVIEQIHALGTVRKAILHVQPTNGERKQLRELLVAVRDAIDSALSGNVEEESREIGVDFFRGLSRALSSEKYRAAIPETSGW